MIITISGNFAEARAITAAVFSKPFAEAGVNVDYLLRQTFMMALDSYVPLPLDTPHPDYPDFILVQEPEIEDAGIGKEIRIPRVYAKKPESFTEPGGNYAYNFIGYFGAFGINTTAVTGRERFTDYAEVQVTRDFFLIGPSGDYATWQEIPIIAETKYYSGTPTLRMDYLGDDDVLQVATTPSRTDYEAMIAADAADTESFSIVVEPSTVTRWQGNIFMRETRRIKAK